MNYYDSDITGRRVNNLSFMLRNTHLYPTPVLPREFRNVETQIVPNVETQIVPTRQIIHHLPLYVSNEELSNFSLNQMLMYILLSILQMRDMITYLQEVAYFDDVDL